MLQSGAGKEKANSLVQKIAEITMSAPQPDNNRSRWVSGSTSILKESGIYLGFNTTPNFKGCIWSIADNHFLLYL